MGILLAGSSACDEAPPSGWRSQVWRLTAVEQRPIPIKDQKAEVERRIGERVDDYKLSAQVLQEPAALIDCRRRARIIEVDVLTITSCLAEHKPHPLIRNLASPSASDHRRDVSRAQGDLDLHPGDNHVSPRVESDGFAVDGGAEPGNWLPAAPSCRAQAI